MSALNNMFLARITSNNDKHIAKFLNQHYQQDSLLCVTLILLTYGLTLSEADLSAVSLFLSDSFLKRESANLPLAKRAYARDEDVARSKPFLV